MPIFVIWISWPMVFLHGHFEEFIHASLADSQAKISLNWLTLTKEKIAFKTLKLIFARFFSALVQASSDLVVVTLFVVTVKGDHPVSTSPHAISFKALM